MQNWNYFNPVRVVFAPGAMTQVDRLVRFRRAVLVTSPGFTRRGVTDRIRQALGARLLTVLDDVKPNPDVLDIDAQARSVRGLDPDCIIAVGGGSSMDTAKALARLLTQSTGKTLAAHFRDDESLEDTRALPVVAVPTTAGTGSEVTPFGTVWDFDRNRKYSVTGGDLYSDTAILDPELTIDLPREVTASSGMDAVSHALESTWNRNANPVTLAFAMASLRLSLAALPVLNERPGDIEQRGAMMQASLLAGMAISQTRTALAHSISYPLTTHFKLPHGIACSFTLPELLRFNSAVDDGRLESLARALGYANPGALADGLARLLHCLEIPAMFSRHVPDAASVMSMTSDMYTRGRADNNLRQVGPMDVETVVKASLGGMFD